MLKVRQLLKYSATNKVKKKKKKTRRSTKTIGKKKEENTHTLSFPFQFS